MADYERMELLAQTAELYYVKNHSQAEIAEQMKFSRSKVSRLLDEAREVGVVQVKVNHPLKRNFYLEERFQQKYNLKNVLIQETGSKTEIQILRGLGRLGALYLSEKLVDNTTLGISWGTAIYEVAQALRPRRLKNFNVVQVIGAIGYGDPNIDGPEVARHLASIFSGQFHTLSAPLRMQDEDAARIMLREPHVKDCLKMGKDADYFLIGIGSLDPQRAALVRAGYLSMIEADQISRDWQAVGDVCARLYDINGEYEQIPYNTRVIGISLNELKDVKGEVVAVAGGAVKAQAILGALRAGLVDVLVTDDAAASEILRIDRG